VEQWIWDNWEHQVGITFLSLDDAFYKMMPYESITEEEYNKRVAEMKRFIPSLISNYELKEEDLDEGTEECSTGACPIR
jgi:ribonucleoside-diphosphate reductase alpha chain/ribonucleoside-triphosphate reductase